MASKNLALGHAKVTLRRSRLGSDGSFLRVTGWSWVSRAVDWWRKSVNK